uniref:uncharacterized protein LOC122610293 n=1 Tax=Erigeron canadensis TaxID=72917 RepID=UPI001CB9C7ED|nr:uncharacterized protein LOC122610293 [Erigeron canadensis]
MAKELPHSCGTVELLEALGNNGKSTNMAHVAHILERLMFRLPRVALASTTNSTVTQTTVPSLLPLGRTQDFDMSQPTNITERSIEGSPIRLVPMASVDVLSDITNVYVSPVTTPIRRGRGRPPKSTKPLPSVNTSPNQARQLGALHIRETTFRTGEIINGDSRPTFQSSHARGRPQGGASVSRIVTPRFHDYSRMGLNSTDTPTITSPLPTSTFMISSRTVIGVDGNPSGPEVSVVQTGETTPPYEIHLNVNSSPIVASSRPRGRPRLSASVPRNVRPRFLENSQVGMNSMGSTITTPPLATPAVMISSRTVIDVNGNAINHTTSSHADTPSETSGYGVNHVNVASTTSTIQANTVRENVVQNPDPEQTDVYHLARQQRRMTEYWDCGDATYTCVYCEEKFWYGERTVRRSTRSNPKFSTCFREGKVQLPFSQHPPQLLQELMDYNGGERGKILRDLNDGGGPYTFCLNGHNHHRIGTLLLMHEDGHPRFAQLYIFDTENEVENRLYALNRAGSSNGDDAILRMLLQELITMFDAVNPLVQSFSMAKDRFRDSPMERVTLCLIATRQRDGRQYNLPTASEVAALIPGDGNPTDYRDVIVEGRGGEPGRYPIKRITELHPSFMALQYPLLFPYGEDGYRLYNPLNFPANTKRKCMSLREYYCFRLQERIREETDSDVVGRRIILPSLFNGGPRHMIQQYQDAMAICRSIGTPDLFVTMTCNPSWVEISRHVENSIPGQPPVDKPEIITRMFKIKLDELMEDIAKNHHFGRVEAIIYTIEFQKRGLPRCHALIFLHKHDKISPDDIDHVISAELPSEQDDPIAFEVVRTHMMHGPCGEHNRKSPCIQPNGTCSKGFPKDYCEETFVNRDGWPRYKRSNNGRQAKVGRREILLDNQFVVPHNIDLVVKYGCHINVEWCNQGSLVKYLFNYFNKGPDRATVSEGQNNRTSYQTVLQQENEIEAYLKCRYVSASEACWKLLGYEMHYRSIAVERLPFHLEGCNTVCFESGENVERVASRENAAKIESGENVERVASRENAAKTKFTEWMTANELYPEGRHLTYPEYPTEFTWHQQDLTWKPKSGSKSVGRLYYVPSSMGQKYYLRMLLNVVRGAQSFKDILTVDGVEHDSFMSACKALHLHPNGSWEINFGSFL